MNLAARRMSQQIAWAGTADYTAAPRRLFSNEAEAIKSRR
jgi:hypothetical protein